MADDSLSLSASGYLYRLIFPNGKCYIGITSRTVEKRFAEHVASSGGGKSDCAVHRAIAKYGHENIKIEELASAEWDSLKTLEIKAISDYNARPPFGYNLTRGGDGVVGFDDVTRAKMGAANIGRKPSKETLAKLSAASKGRTHSKEAKAKISAAHLGLEFSDEHRKKLSHARCKIVASGVSYLTPEGRAKLSATSRALRLGVPRSEETKLKLSAANMGKKASAESRAKQSAALKGRTRPPEVMARIVATRMTNKLAREEAGIPDTKASAWSGKKHSSESLKKMSNAHKGKVLTGWHKAKIAASLKNPDVIAKIIASNTGRIQSPETIAKRLATRAANRALKSASA